MQYYTKKRIIETGKIIGQGGEAIVYEVANYPKYVAKIYKKIPDQSIERKLGWMIQNPPKLDSIHSLDANLAYPKEILYDKHNVVVGYTMERIYDYPKLFTAFNPIIRAKSMPDYDLRYRHRVAMHMALLVDKIHNSSFYIIGDMNESNWLVNAYGGVVLIDTDSFQVECKTSDGSSLFTCPVGKPQYSASELQGKAFAQMKRNSNHDNFALAVLIYQTLNNGNHPFRCHWQSSEDEPSIGEKIQFGLFPYNPVHANKVTAPNILYTLDKLHPELQNLMNQCFIDGHLNPFRRPSAKVWYETLKNTLDDLGQCSCGNYYYRSSNACPECGKKSALIANSLPKPLPISVKSISEIEQNWKFILEGSAYGFLLGALMTFIAVAVVGIF